MFSLILTDTNARTYTYSTDSFRNLFATVRNALVLQHIVSIRLAAGLSLPIESLQDLIDLIDIIK